MKILSPEVTRLLDKLYNLRGSDSVVFKEMESAHQKAEETKERTTAEKAALQEKIAGLEADSKNLSEQGKKLIEVLKGIDKKSFETVIDRLHINFDPEALVERLDSSLPETIITNHKDALYDYDAKIKESEKKSISEVMQEARNQEETVQKVEEILVKEEPAKEEENVQEPVEVKEVVEPVVQKKFDREDLIDLFNDIGLDYLDYTTSDLDQILDHFNEKVIRRNINIFKENDLSLDIFADHINLIYDRELEAKVDRLLRIGKSALDIYLNPTVLTKYDYKGLDKAILLLQNSGLDPKKVPLMAY